MLSKILTEARPVRIFALSCCRSDNTLSMRVLAWASISFTFWKVAGAVGSGFMMDSRDERADGLAHRHSYYIAVHIQIKDRDGQLVVAAHGDRRGVHDAQIPGQDIRIRDVAKAHSIGVTHGVLVVHAIDARGLGDHFGVDLQAAQG